ncbi:TonB-dependent receptor plug domain-containing protein [Pleionea sediminis]|uniref:TonB-dependent receptor plug domain-containing protein n=1 Tax=Pleionea sediminis TaxID=2569479 RepID=UPI001186EE6D|nr:TonB-dependent receptor [Pleionea sediminis]
MRFRISVLTASILAASVSVAEENLDLTEISLEDLLNLKVTVASKKEESLADSASSVSVYNQNVMSSLGYYTLDELSNITPGYSSRKSTGNTVFETRGAFGDLNAKHLLLIDGIPVNHARDYMAMAQEHLPLHFAKQVEFLRGPASALYGVSAFNGVISITSDDADSDEFYGQVSRGSVNNENRVMLKSLHKTEHGKIHFSYGSYQKDDSLAEIPGFDPFVGSYRVQNYLRDGQDSSFTYFTYTPTTENLEGFKFGIINMAKTSNFWEAWNGGQDTSEISRETRDTWIYYLKYSTDLMENLTLNSYVKYNNSTERGIQENNIWVANPGVDQWYFSFDVDSSSYEGLVEVNWQIDENSSFISGINYDDRYQNEPGAFLFDANVPDVDAPFFTRSARTQSFYAQYSREFNVLDGLIFTAGVRSDEGTIAINNYTETSPRIAVVQRLNENFNIKFMRGHALKAPGIAEANQNTEKAPALRNPADVPNVDPEVIDVNELQVTYTDGGLFASLTYFENTIEDSIIRQVLDCSLYVAEPDPNNCDNDNRTGDQPDFFLNDSGEADSTGVEFDLQYYQKNYWVLFNVAYSDTENDKNPFGAVNAPETKVNLIGNYRFDGEIPINASLITRYVSEYNTSTSSKYSGQTTLDANVTFTLSDSFDASIRIKNLTDKEYYQPNDGSDGIPMPERSILLSLSSKL